MIVSSPEWTVVSSVITASTYLVRGASQCLEGPNRVWRRTCQPSWISRAHVLALLTRSRTPTGSSVTVTSSNGFCLAGVLWDDIAPR
jgi:ribosomal protein L34